MKYIYIYMFIYTNMYVYFKKMRIHIPMNIWSNHPIPGPQDPGRSWESQGQRCQQRSCRRPGLRVWAAPHQNVWYIMCDCKWIYIYICIRHMYNYVYVYTYIYIYIVCYTIYIIYQISYIIYHISIKNYISYIIYHIIL